MVSDSVGLGKAIAATKSTIALGGAAVFVIGLAWILQILTTPPATVTLNGIATQLIGGSLALGGLILIFLTFNFAMLKIYDTSDKMQILYSWSSFGIFTAGVIAVIDSLLFALYLISENLILISSAFSILLVAVTLFLVSVGVIVLQQLGG